MWELYRKTLFEDELEGERRQRGEYKDTRNILKV
jgi:hypothetical protein